MVLASKAEVGEKDVGGVVEASHDGGGAIALFCGGGAMEGGRFAPNAGIGELGSFIMLDAGGGGGGAVGGGAPHGAFCGDDD